MIKHRRRVASGLFGSVRPVARMSVAAAVAAAIAAPTAVWSQSADATLQGTAAPNTEVVAHNKLTGITRKVMSRADGSYILVGLPPGEYSVTSGKTSYDVTLSVATTSQLDLTAALEEVIVSGQRRLVEVRTSEVGAIVSSREIETLPAITRNFLEFADSVPGVAFTVDGSGNTSFRGGAQQDQNVNVFIDGISMKDYVQGGLSGQSGSNKNPNQGDPGNPFPQSAIDEYKVITSNYKAEYDQLASAAIAASTKSGTNTFKGDAFATFTNQNLRADTPAEIASGSINNPKAGGSKTDEWGVSFGGPIIQDKLHYFAAFERKELSLPNVVYPSANSNLTIDQAKALLPAGVGDEFGPTTNPFSESLFFGKLDYEPGTNNRFELWDLNRVEHQIAGASGQTAASASSQFKNKNNRMSLRWQHFGDGWLNEARLSYQDANSGPETQSTRPQYIYNYLTNSGPQQLIATNGGTAWSQFANSQKGTTLQDDFTWNDLQWKGTHTVKAGIKLSSIDLLYQDAGQGSQFDYIVTAAGTAPDPYKATFTLQQPGKSATATSKDKQYGVYIQDDWKIDSHWSLNLGIRWDYEKVPSWEDFQLPAGVKAGLFGPHPMDPNITYDQALALGGVNINDYIGNGSNRKPQSDEFQPRLGVSFDIDGDQRHVVYGGYGRSYDRNIYDLMSLELTKSALSEPTVNFYGNSPYTEGGCSAQTASPGSCQAWDPAYLTSLSALQGTQHTPFGEVNLINNKIKNPYSDQFSIGIRNRLGEWNSDIGITQVNSYNRLVGWLGNRMPNGDYYAHCGWGTGDGYAPNWCMNTAPPGAAGNLVLWDNAARDKNTSVHVAFEKPYTHESGWSAHIGYTYSSAKQTDYYPYAGNNAYQFDFPQPKQFPWVSSSAVAKHRLVMTGSIDGSWNMVWSAKVVLATPANVGGWSIGCPTLNSPGCGGNWLIPTSGHPRDLFGERTVDVAATKNFEFSHDMKAYARLDILNLFNTPYYDPTAASWNGLGYQAVNPPPKFNTSGPILGVPFTIKISGGFSW